jgi:hypothetical protein
MGYLIPQLQEAYVNIVDLPEKEKEIYIYDLINVISVLISYTISSVRFYISVASR